MAVRVAAYACCCVPPAKEDVEIETGLGAGCTPVPDSETIVGEPAALLAMLSVPLIVPCADGVNVTPILVVLPGDRVSGSVAAAATTNWEALGVMPLTVRFAVPEFFTVIN